MRQLEANLVVVVRVIAFGGRSKLGEVRVDWFVRRASTTASREAVDRIERSPCQAPAWRASFEKERVMTGSFTNITTIITTTILALIASSSCRNEAFDEKWNTTADRAADEQGGSGREPAPLLPRAIHLPAPDGEVLLCTQGISGEFSHTYPSTVRDLDFDTDNYRDEEVFAPARGVARLHDENPSAGFGIHVNIDLGDGSYVVLAHLKRVFVADLEEVAAGQLLGYEGCTGLCTGDHIHIGRHRGDPGLSAENGDSIEGRYFLRDLGASEGTSEISGDAFVCDPKSGYRYASALPIVRWHPDGTLVRVPDRADVYRIDLGTLRRIATQEVFSSYKYDFANVVLISGQEFGCYNHGNDIGALGMVEAAYDRDGALWLFVAPRERTDRYRIRVQPLAWEAVLASWGLSYTSENPPRTRDENDDLFRFWPEKDSFAVFRDGTLVKENGSSTVYVISNGSALPIKDWDTHVGLGYFARGIIDVPVNSVLYIQRSVGSCRYGIGCVDAERIHSCGDRGDMKDMGGVSSEMVQDTTNNENPPDNGDDRGLSVYQQSPDEAPDESERHLVVTWTTPFSAVANRITLSGEYRFADQTYGFFWHVLAENRSDHSITFALAGVGSGDMFRFSVEYEATDGNVSWSCIGPHPNGYTQGRVSAEVDGTSVATSMAGDPMSTGCGLILTIP